MAFKTNALIIPACGFDSIPPDIAVFVANRYVKVVLGSEASIEDSVTAYDVKGGFSGGSTDFIMSLVEDVPSQAYTRSVRDYALRHRESCDCSIPQRFMVFTCSSWTPQPSREIGIQAPIRRGFIMVGSRLATADDQPSNSPPLLVVVRTQ